MALPVAVISTDVTNYCVNHPAVETVVGCSRCEKPICPRCMIDTPVGKRCRECAQLRRAPLYDVGGPYLWRAVGAAVGAAIAGSFVFDLALSVLGRSILFAGLLCVGVGIAVAELLSAAANRKRGPRLQLLSVATVITVTQSGPLLSWLLLGRMAFTPVGLLLTAVASVIAWQRLK